MATANLHPTQAGVDRLTPADEALLNTKIKDGLAKKLGTDWKRFARGTEFFNENQIETIDLEERTVYEKCHKMLRQWEQRSIAKVTIGMAKLNLYALGRNDILLDLFNSPPGPGQSDVASIGPGSIGNLGLGKSNVDNYTEPTVSDLQYKHIKKLCNFLDPDHGIGIQNWQQLGNAIFQGDKDASDRIESLHLSYSGGGSPAKEFLKTLSMRYPTFTVNRFIEIAKQHQRRDISSYLEGLNCQPGLQFRDLTFSHQEKVARDLDKNIRGISDWRAFADAVGFSNDDIAEFKLALKEGHQYSPTQSLIDLMKGRYPLLNLSKIKLASSSIGRNDVAQYLGSVIDEIALLRARNI